jgi:prepilin signal peptidase PulO-like enzyme (type II secretory pathway)
MRRDIPAHGPLFWLRPMMIELVWAIGLPWFYHWQISGGLTGGAAAPLAWCRIWFSTHTILLTLMFVATFIDFDEFTIPDAITVPGTLIALMLAAALPQFRLPEVFLGLGGAVVRPIHFNSPGDLPTWHRGWQGLAAAAAIFSVWIAALLPCLITLRYGIKKAIPLLIAHMVRPVRKTVCPVRVKQRRIRPQTTFFFAIWPCGVLAILAAYRWLDPSNWDSLFGSLLGLAFAGGMIWSIRIVGSYAMQQEAMGFGDVTLMAMIGAFLGWQASLLTFVFAPFAALLIAIVSFVLTRQHELAFGPYLCFSAFMMLLFWAPIWDASRQGIFGLGGLLLIILAASLILLAVMLMGIRWFKERAFVQPPE